MPLWCHFARSPQPALGTFEIAASTSSPLSTIYSAEEESSRNFVTSQHSTLQSAIVRDTETIESISTLLVLVEPTLYV